MCIFHNKATCLIMAGLFKLLYTFRYEHARLLDGRFDRVHLVALFVHECTELLVNFIYTNNILLQKDKTS